MSSLPDDVLLQVLEMGNKTRRLDHRDLCNLAMVNSQFNELSNDSSLWATLLSRDFPSSHYPSSEPPSKSLYRKKFEEEKMAAPEARKYLLPSSPVRCFPQ
ncbi:F-box protein SKIP24 [Carex littledalei]|uniref:F-box protein SKIP24 n=1 Tax=Carex littledalei TaxID=544730 RepID=A0A833RSN8_9POAL|nr:F-box protein SKIP24 [Carex littledalei]